jgi:hypothetical protein
VVVFVQSDSAKTVYQSETINNNDLTITSVDNDKNKTPGQYLLSQNYPNPFNPSTKIYYSVPTNNYNNAAFVELTVFDILGNKISTLVNENKSQGNYEVEFDAKNLSSGIYFYNLKAGYVWLTNKMILLK